MKGKGKGKDSAKAASPTQGIQRTLLLEPTKLPPHRAGMSGTRTVITLIPVGTMPHMMNSTHIYLLFICLQGKDTEQEEEKNTKRRRSKGRGTDQTAFNTTVSNAFESYTSQIPHQGTEPCTENASILTPRAMGSRCAVNRLNSGAIRSRQD